MKIKNKWFFSFGIFWWIVLTYQIFEGKNYNTLQSVLGNFFLVFVAVVFTALSIEEEK